MVTSKLSRAAKKIKHPGKEKAAAARNGISTQQQLENDAHRKGNSPAAKSARARGNLGLALSRSARRRAK